MQQHTVDAPPAFVDPAEVRATEDLRDLHRIRARYDPCAFNSYVLKDEETGRSIVAQPAHVEWHQLATAHRRLIIWGHVESGKSQQISIGRSLYELGLNSNLRIVIVSNTDKQAQKICRAIAKYIEQDAELHEIFPDLVKAPDGPWTSHQLTIVRETYAKDASVQTCGVHGNIMGARIDLLIVDDILDFENALSEKQREDLFHWFMATFWGRLTKGARVWALGNPWHIDDLLHRWARNTKVWMAVKYSMLDADGQSVWASRWPMSRIQDFKDEVGPEEFARQLLCVARSEESARFKRDYITRCLRRGIGSELIEGLEVLPEGYSCYTGVDLSVGYKHSDLCVLFTILVHPNEDREILDIESGRWGGPDIVDRVIGVHHRFNSKVIVENNGSQEFILQFTRKQSAVPVEPYTTTKNAFRDPAFGIESLAAEMANGKWIIPCDAALNVHPEVGAWIKELLYYDPDKHAGDRLMASFFAREGARRVVRRGHMGRIDLVSR